MSKKPYFYSTSIDFEAYKCSCCHELPSEHGLLSGANCTAPHYICKSCYKIVLQDSKKCPICRASYMQNAKSPAEPIYHFFDRALNKKFDEQRLKEGLERNKRVKKKIMCPSIINLMCKYCKKQCFSGSNFYRHVNLHINGPYQCKKCQNIYHNTRHDCTREKKRGIKKVKCKQCDACFVNKSNLRRHLRSKICRTCKTCKYVFPSHKILRLHHSKPSACMYP